MARRKLSHKQLAKIFTQYGIHLWAILILANAAMVYTYHFATQAASKDATNVASIGGPSPSVSPSPSTQVSPSSGPLGPTINLDFMVPGIGSGGGVMKPLHQQRSITMYLYAPGVNSMDPTVNPLYTIQGTATFDANPESPTYTSYLNPTFDLGSDVKDGQYQIAFRTDLSFATLIKQHPSDIGGEVLSISRGNPLTEIPSQTVLMGDSIPSGNNFAFTINDYNAFINCYGDKNTTSNFCKGKNYADFNDDGVVNGIDYNILLRSLRGLVQQGETLPQISIIPTVSVKHPAKPTHAPKVTAPTKKDTPTKAVQAKVTPATKKGGSGGGIAFVLIFFVLLAGVLGFLYFKNEKFKNLINALIHLSPTGTPSEETETTDDQTAADASTETPEAQAAPGAQPAAQTPAPAAPAENIVEKDCYIKKKGPDEKGTGVWLQLTDDNGEVDAHYNKTTVTDGFAKVKGIMKTENGKSFMEVSEIFAEE